MPAKCSTRCFHSTEAEFLVSRELRRNPASPRLRAGASRCPSSGDSNSWAFSQSTSRQCTPRIGARPPPGSSAESTYALGGRRRENLSGGPLPTAGGPPWRRAVVAALPSERAAELEAVLHYRELTLPNRTQRRILDELFSKLQNVQDFRDRPVGMAFRLLVEKHSCSWRCATTSRGSWRCRRPGISSRAMMGNQRQKRRCCTGTSTDR